MNGVTIHCRSVSPIFILEKSWENILLTEFHIFKSKIHFYEEKYIYLPSENTWVNVAWRSVYLGFNVAFNTVHVISRQVVGRAEETST